MTLSSRGRLEDGNTKIPVPRPRYDNHRNRPSPINQRNRPNRYGRYVRLLCSRRRGALDDGTIRLGTDARRSPVALLVRPIGLRRADSTRPTIQSASGCQPWQGRRRAWVAVANDFASPAERRLSGAGLQSLVHRFETPRRATRANGRQLSDQSRHRVAAFRCPTADRGGRPGKGVGCGSRADASQGSLASHTQPRLRLPPARRRWT
jgi:hypothetical protein